MSIDNKEKMLEMYTMMVRIREFENEAIELAKMNLTRAAIHTYNGEEAIATGICQHLTNEDYISSNHRGHGHCIAKGADIRRMYAELMARETGFCKGRGGSMHIADMSVGMLGANGIVGAGIPIAIGAAFAIKYKEKPNVVVSFFGDGASNQGTFHESVNMAAVYNLPVIFVCENNQYGISMHVSESTSVHDIADRAKSYGINGHIIDGNDVMAVYTKMGEIIENVRLTCRPVLVEMKTYRMSGHYFGDSENYRSKEDVIKWKEKCPIKRAREVLTVEYGFTQETLDDIWAKEKKNILAASELAKGDTKPSALDLSKDVYDPSFAQIQWKQLA